MSAHKKAPNSKDGLNNRFNSYQQGSYTAPGMNYAEQQTNTLGDTLQTQYQAESTPNAVLNQLHTQRGQLQSANEDVWDMRQATEQTKRELMDLQAKYRAKKNKLRIIIGILSLVDLLLFLRIARCRGSFFC